MTVPRWLINALTFIGIASAIAGALVRGVQGQPFFELLVCTAIIAYWVQFVLYIDSAKRHRELLEAVVRTGNGDSQQPLERSALIRLLRSGAFEGCHIDSEFWAHFGRDVLADARKDSAKLDIVLGALRTARVEVEEPHRIYSYMHTLLRSVQHRGGRYHAITTPEELAKDEGRNFVLRLSQMYPKVIRRILVLPPGTGPRALSKEVRRALRQVNDAVEMRFLCMPLDEVGNFGIYGDAAVGILDQSSWRNEFIFDPEVVESKIRLFGDLWSQAEELSDTLLGDVPREQGDSKPPSSVVA